MNKKIIMNSQQVINSKFVKQGIQGATVMGKTYAIIGSVIGIIIGLILIIFGSIFQSDPHTTLVKGRILYADCVQNANNNFFTCNITFEYSMNNSIYVEVVQNFNSSRQISRNDSINVYVNPNNPTDISFYRSPTWLNVILLVIGILFVLFSLLYIYFINRYQALAFVSGMSRATY
jgi:hypothetical protein